MVFLTFSDKPATIIPCHSASRPITDISWGLNEKLVLELALCGPEKAPMEVGSIAPAAWKNMTSWASLGSLYQFHILLSERSIFGKTRIEGKAHRSLVRHWEHICLQSEGRENEKKNLLPWLSLKMQRSPPEAGQSIVIVQFCSI